MKDNDEEIVETNDEGDEPSGKDQLKKLREKLKEALAEKQKYLENWQRDKAEFINARKRDELARGEFLKFAEEKIIEELLPVLDSFDLALKHNGNHEDVSIIHQQFQKVLDKYGVQSFGEVGDDFEPNLHHSVGAVSGGKSHTIAELLQKGYKMRDKVIRPALVKIYE